MFKLDLVKSEQGYWDIIFTLDKIPDTLKVEDPKKWWYGGPMFSWYDADTNTYIRSSHSSSHHIYPRCLYVSGNEENRPARRSYETKAGAQAVLKRLRNVLERFEHSDIYAQFFTVPVVVSEETLEYWS